MQKPNKRYPSAPGSSPSMVPGILPDISLQDVHFSELVKNRGLKFKHSKGVPCPNVRDINELIHLDHCHHPKCWNGMLQIDERECWGFFNNDQLNKLYEIQGEYDENIAIITMSATYEDGTEADFHHFDRLVMEEYSKRTYELIEHNPSGVDRLKYYALDVHSLQTPDKEFQKDVDFTVDNGRIKWISNNRPGYDQALNRGQIYTIGYYVRPIYYVHHVMKELRATQVYDQATGEKVAVRLPQHLYVIREVMYPDTTDDTGDQTSKMPRSGILPPR